MTGATIFTGAPVTTVTTSRQSDALTMAIGTTGRSPPVRSLSSTRLRRLRVRLRQPHDLVGNGSYARAEVLHQEGEPDDGDDHRHEDDERQRLRAALHEHGLLRTREDGDEHPVLRGDLVLHLRLLEVRTEGVG